MKAYYDLHLHSCLSPCADDEMTPANIAGMAHIKGLHIISLTDHNCGRNLPSMAAAAQHFGLVFVPGIEVTTSEEVHVLTYFEDVDKAVAFGEQMYASLPDIPCRPDIFGRQIVMDKDDCEADEPQKLLISATAFSIDDVSKMAREQGGCAVPAHINRDSFSVMSNLGFLPPGLFGCVEIDKALPCSTLDSGLFVFHSSDAHRLADISEPLHCLEDIQHPHNLVCFINSLHY